MVTAEAQKESILEAAKVGVSKKQIARSDRDPHQIRVSENGLLPILWRIWSY